MKQLGLILLGLVMIALLLALPIVARHPRPAPDCASRIVMARGAEGQPLECVCVQDTLSTCFSPGP
jgi:hypothetical protein